MHHLSKKKKHWQCIANQVQENRQAHWNFSDVSSDTGYYEICCSACKVKFNMSYNRIFPFRVHRRTKLTVIHLTVMLLKSGKLKFFLSLKGEKGKLAGFLLLSCTKLSKTAMFVSICNSAPLARGASWGSCLIAWIFFVLLRLENSDIRQVAVELCIIQTITNNKVVRTLKRTKAN